MNQITNVNTMTSLEVAELTGKRHDQILRDVRDEVEKLQNQGIIADHIFVEGEYQDKNNQSRPMYILTKEGVLQLAARYDAVVRFRLIERVTVQQKPLSPVQQLLAQAQMLVEMESRVSTVEKGIARIENNQRRTVTSNQLTVIAYANMKGIKANKYHAPSMGKKATKICKDKGLLIGTVVDSKYGLINTYPQEVLDEVFFG